MLPEYPPDPETRNYAQIAVNIKHLYRNRISKATTQRPIAKLTEQLKKAITKSSWPFNGHIFVAPDDPTLLDVPSEVREIYTSLNKINGLAPVAER